MQASCRILGWRSRWPSLLRKSFFDKFLRQLAYWCGQAAWVTAGWDGVTVGPSRKLLVYKGRSHSPRHVPSRPAPLVEPSGILPKGGPTRKATALGSVQAGPSRLTAESFTATLDRACPRGSRGK